MANGEILRGSPGLPLYGKNGTLLYSTTVSVSLNIVISWTGGSDVDICGFYTHFPSTSVGYGHDSTIDDGNGFTANWTSGDNTSGGPERISLAYSGENGVKGKSFEIHANWYRVGSGSDDNEGSGGPATITATDAKGNVRSATIMPATSRGRAAQAGDPGVIIRFNFDGTIKEVAAI